jgi:hypothetical protein
MILRTSSRRESNGTYACEQRCTVKRCLHQRPKMAFLLEPVSDAAYSLNGARSGQKTGRQSSTALKSARANEDQPDFYTL